MIDEKYIEIRVWKRRGETLAILYRCFNDLETGKFSVQSADFFRLPIGDELRGSEKQFLELFMEISPRDRCEWFPTLVEAIAAHDLDFS